MEIVWCNGCKTVVWAYDHAEPSNRAGVANGWSLPCPRCGTKGNFGGWSAPYLYDKLRELIVSQSGQNVYDDWSAMKAVAHRNAVSWNPSGDNLWFRSHTNITLPEVTLPDWGDWSPCTHCGHSAQSHNKQAPFCTSGQYAPLCNCTGYNGTCTPRPHRPMVEYV